MQPRLLFALLCDDVREEKSGKLTIIGLYNCVIGFSAAPPTSLPPGASVKYALPQLCIVLRWMLDAPLEKTVTEILGPGDALVAKVDAPLLVSQDEGHPTQILRFFGIPLDDGPHKLRITCGASTFEEHFLVKVPVAVQT